MVYTGNQYLLLETKVNAKKMETYRERSFSFLAPKLCNSLPINLWKEPKFDKLKSQLKAVFIRVNNLAL